MLREILSRWKVFSDRLQRRYGTAQIYDTQTGVQTWCVLLFLSSFLFFKKTNVLPFHLLTSELNHGQTPESGHLYIRSLCFSPDAKRLATGAEDKEIRVLFHSPSLIR